MLCGCADTKCLIYLNKASVVISHLNVIANHKLTVFYCFCMLYNRGIIQKNTCIMAIDPVCVCINQIGTVSCYLLKSRNYVIILQILKEIKSLCNLLLAILQSAILYPILTILTLQVINHKECTVQFLRDHWIVRFVICLKGFSCCQQFI